MMKVKWSEILELPELNRDAMVKSWQEDMPWAQRYTTGCAAMDVDYFLWLLHNAVDADRVVEYEPTKAGEVGYSEAHALIWYYYEKMQTLYRLDEFLAYYF